MTAPTPVERDDPSINRAIPGCWNCERRGRQQWSRLCLPRTGSIGPRDRMQNDEGPLSDVRVWHKADMLDTAATSAFDPKRNWSFQTAGGQDLRAQAPFFRHQGGKSK